MRPCRHSELAHFLWNVFGRVDDSLVHKNCSCWEVNSKENPVLCRLNFGDHRLFPVSFVISSSTCCLSHCITYLKGIVQIFKVGLYEMPMYTKCVSYSRCQSARPQFGEAVQNGSSAMYCSGGVSNQTCFSYLKTPISVYVCAILRIFSLLNLIIG